MSASSFFVQPFVAPVSSGALVPSSELNFWQSGEIGSVRQAVFADAGLTTPLLQPVASDATGVFPQIFLTPGSAYGVVWTTSSVYPNIPSTLNVWDPYSTSLPSPFVGDSGGGGVQGIVPAPPAGSAALNEYLGADGGWDPLLVTPPAANVSAKQAGFLGAPFGNNGVPLTVNYTIVLADVGKGLVSGTVSGLTLTLPSDATGGWTANIGTVILLAIAYGNGAFTIAPAAGVTLLSPPGFTASANRTFTWGIASLQRWGVNLWMLAGTNIS